MQHKLISILFIFSSYLNAQLVGLWKHDVDTNAFGMHIKGNNYYLFTELNRVFHFSSETDLSTPDLSCYTLMEKKKNFFILRRESKLTDEYNGEDQSQTIYSGKYQNEDYDTIDFKIKGNAVRFHHRNNQWDSWYYKYSNKKYKIVDSVLLRKIRLKLRETDVNLQSGSVNKSKSEIGSLFDMWLLKDDFLFLFFVQSVELRSLIAQRNFEPIINLYSDALKDGRKNTKQKCAFTLYAI